MLYNSPDGSGGMSSWRSELINALLIAQALNRTLLLREEHGTTRALQISYDIPAMRFHSGLGPSRFESPVRIAGSVRAGSGWFGSGRYVEKYRFCEARCGSRKVKIWRFESNRPVQGAVQRFSPLC